MIMSIIVKTFLKQFMFDGLRLPNRTAGERGAKSTDVPKKEERDIWQLM
jgi:hypothetical protein